MLSDSDEEHIGEIERDINEMNFKASQVFNQSKKKKLANGKAKVGAIEHKQNGAGGDHHHGRSNGHHKKEKSGAKPSKKRARKM